MASAVPALDSSALATQLKAKVPSVTKIVTITENNDPNECGHLIWPHFGHLSS
jgi:hypothetical protein